MTVAQGGCTVSVQVAQPDGQAVGHLLIAVCRAELVQQGSVAVGQRAVTVVKLTQASVMHVAVLKGQLLGSSVVVGRSGQLRGRV